MAASVGGLKTDALTSARTAGIDRRRGKAEDSNEPADVPQDQIITGPKERREALKEITRDLHNGQDMAVLKQRFKELVYGVQAPEIAKIEQELLNEGLTAEEIKRFCEVHVEIFKEVGRKK